MQELGRGLWGMQEKTTEISLFAPPSPCLCVSEAASPAPSPWPAPDLEA